MVTIYDRKQVIVIENPKASLDESPCLWSNKHSDLYVVTIVRNVFGGKRKKIKNYSKIGAKSRVNDHLDDNYKDFKVCLVDLY